MVPIKREIIKQATHVTYTPFIPNRVHRGRMVLHFPWTFIFKFKPPILTIEWDNTLVKTEYKITNYTSALTGTTQQYKEPIRVYKVPEIYSRMYKSILHIINRT